MSKGCDNCYYEFFGEKAYPCSLCIRGIKRTDKWQAKIHERQVNCESCKHYADVSIECDRCDKSIHSRYEPKKGNER